MGTIWAQNYTKEEFRKKKMSGVFQYKDPRTGRVTEEGKFENGVEVGLWKEYDQDGDEIHYEFSKQKAGAICKDGTRSKATGRGAGSHHGGVKEWIFSNSMKKVGGTGKFMSVEHRVSKLKEKAKQEFGLSQNGL